MLYCQTLKQWLNGAKLHLRLGENQERELLHHKAVNLHLETTPLCKRLEFGRKHSFL